MSTRETRLRRLEADRAPASRVIVVTGYPEAEHRAKVEALKASSEASDNDLFLCIMKFGAPV